MLYRYVLACCVGVHVPAEARDQSGMSFFRMTSTLFYLLRQYFSLTWKLLIGLNWSAGEP